MVRKTLSTLIVLAGCHSISAEPRRQEDTMTVAQDAAPVDSQASLLTGPARHAHELVGHVWYEEGIPQGICYLREENNNKLAHFMDPQSRDWYEVSVRLDHGLAEECPSDWCENVLQVQIKYARGGHPTVVIDEHMNGTCDRACDSGQDYDQNPQILQNKYESLVRRLNEIYRSLPKDANNPSQ